MHRKRGNAKLGYSLFLCKKLRKLVKKKYSFWKLRFFLRIFAASVVKCQCLSEGVVLSYPENQESEGKRIPSKRMLASD
jgi:hypothetical protein